MKSLINRKSIFWAVMLVLCTIPASLSGAFLESKDILEINSISRFFEAPPQGIGLKYLSSALNSENLIVKGVAAGIFYKHFGKKFEKTFYNCMSLSLKKSKMDIGKRKIFKFEELGKILAMSREASKKIKHETAKELVEFFFFRKNNAWLVGTAGEKLSLASFARVKLLKSLLGQTFDPIELSKDIDLKTK